MNNLHLITVTYLLIVIAATIAALIQEQEEEVADMEHLLNETAKAKKERKRQASSQGDETINKRRCTKFDYERARLCVQNDHLGPNALLDRSFERIFRVSRTIFDRILNLAGAADPFFTYKLNPVTKRCIYPEVKVLMALKCVAFGVAPIAFCDHFQMGDSAGRACLKNLCHVIAKGQPLRQKYLRKMTKSDARKVGELHQREFGIPGIMGCLDCMHVYWKNCPAAWQGQCKGAKEQPSLVLEAISDYNLWFWHVFFGPPGALNDINVWDRSTMLRSFLDGTFDECDYEHTIAGKVFKMVTFLVDGIYPELARFVKTVSVPLNRVQKKHAAWQEGARKSIE